jgi:hypothetical protein
VDMHQQASAEPLIIYEVYLPQRRSDVGSLDLVLLITSFGSIRSHCNVMISIQHPLYPTEDALHADGICKRELAPIRPQFVVR